jgi:hypothetical protein
MSLSEKELENKGLPVNTQFSQSTSHLQTMSLHKIDERHQTDGDESKALPAQMELHGDA